MRVPPAALEPRNAPNTPPCERMGFDSCRRGAHLRWGPGSPSYRCRRARWANFTAFSRSVVTVSPQLPPAPTESSNLRAEWQPPSPRSGSDVASSAPSAEATSCSASGLQLPVTRPGHRRTASATCRRPSPTAAAASSTRCRSRALRCPRTSGRGSPAPRGRGCTGPSSTMPAVGRGRAAGRWSSTATAGPCRPGGPLGTQPSSGQFRWSCTRSPRWGSAPGRGNSERRGCVCTGSRPQLRRASTPPTPTRAARSSPLEPAVGTVEPPEQPATVTPRATAAAAHRCDGRMIPRFDTTRPSGCRFRRTVTCYLCRFAVGHASSQASVDVASTYVVFDTPTICSGDVRSPECACVDRRGRALHGRSHPRWPTPGSDRR